MKINVIDTKYEVKSTNQFNKGLKKVFKQGKDLGKLKKVIEDIANDVTLDKKHRNHKLNDSKLYQNCYECHIEPDWLLVYQYINNDLVLLLVNTGSHSDIL